MFEFVCVLFLTHEFDQHMYIGNFPTCEQAYKYIEDHYTSEEYKWIKCQHQDYLYLPKNFVKKEIKYEQ